MTKEQAIELMKSRGYVMTSEAGNAKWVGFSKDMNGIWMSATVHLESDSIEIAGAVLKMGCQLKTGKFDVHHKKYDEFEQWLYFYGKVCGEIENVVEQMDYIPARVYLAHAGLSPAEPEKPKKTLKDRINEFKDAVIRVGKDKGHTPAMCKAFFIYWSEVNDGGKKMRWEIMKAKKGTFNIGGRMVTWKKNEEVYGANFKDRTEKKAEKQNKELVAKDTVKTKTLF